MKKIYFLILSLAALGCNHDIPMVNLGIDDTYYIHRMQKLDLHPALTGKEYRWYQILENGDRNLLSEQKDYIFISSTEGIYNLRFEILDPDTPYCFDFRINVVHEEVEYSPFITRVYEYCPAPGQFINEMPRYEEGDTYASILQKCEESISGKNDIMISLGGYGGYVTFGFDHTVMNIKGEKDLRIWGNAFYELTNPDAKGGSAEPGIVMVSYDVNCNGLPDDPWYELAGSEYHSPLTIHDYNITYYRPKPEKKPEPDDSGFLTDTTYITWTDSEGKTGYVAKNSFHGQDYFPKWVNDDTIEFKGTLLAPNAKDLSGMGTYYVLYSYDWGYVDNHPNDYADLNSFDIGWAVDSNGNHIDLPGIDFVRVYTGVNQYCGWLGETSTEVCRARDLHLRDFSDPSETPIPTP